MACKVFRDQNNKISRVLDTNGQESKLYEELITYAKEEPNVFVDDYHIQDLVAKGLVVDNSAEELALGGWDKAYVKYGIVEEPTLNSIKDDLFADSLFNESNNLLFAADNNSTNKQETKLDIQTYDKLLNLIHKLGFNIERMEEWKEKWEKKNGRKFDDSAILGLTDFVNKALVLKDLSDVTFGEEAAHIIISSVKGTPQYNRATEEVVNTQEYRDNYDAYMELYKDVEKVKEEVLGKILLNKIMNGSTREGLSSRLFKALSDIWVKIKEMFTGNKTTEVRAFINELYSNIQNENMGFFGEVNTEGILLKNQRTSVNINIKDIRNSDGSKKRYSNYDDAFNKVKRLNSTIDTSLAAFTIVKIMGEKGDSRIYYSIGLKTKQEGVFFTVDSFPDGRLAQTDGENIIIRKGITKKEFFNYIQGNDVSVTSQQKQLTLKVLQDTYGISYSQIEELLETEQDIANFIYNHELSHIKNNDKHSYWKQGRDLLSEDKVAIEARANYDAFLTIRAQKQQQLMYRIDEDAYKTSKKLKLYEDKLREAIKVRIKKFKIYKNKRTEKGNERELERIDKLMKLLANDQIDLGIVTYINHANEELEVAHNRFKDLLDNINSKNYRELAEQLNTLRSYIAAHKPLVKGLVKDLRRLPDDIKEELIILNAAIDTIEQEFFESSSYILAEQLLPFYATIPELGITTVSQVQDLLMKAPKDISWFSAWFRSMANSGDLILQGLDQIIKGATIKAQEEADTLIRSLYKANRLVNKPYEWMLNGRYFISKYDMQKWNTNLEKFMQELYVKYNLPADKKERDAFFDTLQLEATSAYADSIINDYITARLEVLNATEYGKDALKRSKKQKGLGTELARVNWAIDQVYNMYKVDQARWFENNTQTNPEYAKIIEERLREFFDSRMDEDQQKDEYFAYVINKVLSDATNLYGEKYSNYPKDISDPSTNRNLKMVIEDAQHWVSSNRGFSEYKAKNGESGFYYKRRLSLPSDSYLDSRFDAIQKDVNKKAYYDKVIELKKQMDSYLPEEHRDEFLIPQIRKDFLERLVKSPKTVLQEVKDGVIIREDDTEFGMDYQLTDENNNPVKMLPVFYTRNIERLEDMSTDITSVLAAYINMATRHKQMSEIESTMELALINVENRQIEIGDDVLGKGDSKFSQFFKGSKNIDRKLGGNAADALREYINMQVYGERKAKQEFEFFGAKLSFSKMTDLFNTYVSLNTLAFNPYSAIANITTSSVYRRMEAAAGQFYNNKNLLWADAFYTKNITGVLNDVGKLESNNPLRLFLEYTDALDSFDKDVRGANAERSRFGRAFNTSSLFAFQHIGDHIVQSRVALAMADKFEVFNSKGEKIHLIKDALVFGENELRIEEGTKKKDGTPLTIQDLKFFGNKVKKVNQDLDGIYNDADAAAAQKYAQGRIIMLYRKYLVPGLDKRFRGISGGKIADLTLETTKEGMYVTSGRFMYNLMKEVKANHWRLLSTTKEEWNNLSEQDKQNIIRTTTEMAYIFAVAIIGTILTEASDDDEENNLLALAAYSANRLYTELRQYNNISEAYKILKSPAAGIRQLENLTEIFSKTFDPLGYAFSDDPFLREYKSGKNEGQTYFWVKTQKALPFVNTFDKWKIQESSYNI